jgi:hypothetical protein
VTGKYAVLRRDSLKEGEPCIVMLGINVSLFHNVINNLNKIRNTFLTVHNIFKHILSRKETQSVVSNQAEIKKCVVLISFW